MYITDNFNPESFYQGFSEPSGYGAFDDYDEPEESDVVLDEYCPNCHHEYDEIDYEYQICHICHYENKPIPYKVEEVELAHEKAECAMSRLKPIEIEIMSLHKI